MTDETPATYAKILNAISALEARLDRVEAFVSTTNLHFTKEAIEQLSKRLATLEHPTPPVPALPPVILGQLTTAAGAEIQEGKPDAVQTYKHPNLTVEVKTHYNDYVKEMLRSNGSEAPPAPPEAAIAELSDPIPDAYPLIDNEDFSESGWASCFYGRPNLEYETIQRLGKGASSRFVLPRFWLWMLTDPKHGALSWAGGSEKGIDIINNAADILRLWIDFGKEPDLGKWRYIGSRAAYFSKSECKACAVVAGITGRCGAFQICPSGCDATPYWDSAYRTLVNILNDPALPREAPKDAT